MGETLTTAARPAAEALWEELLAAPQAGFAPHFLRPDLLELILAQSQEVLVSDPERAERWAHWAERLAEALRAGRRIACDRQARAWRLIAQARRLREDFERAEDALGDAFNHLAAGSAERPHVHVAAGLLRLDELRPDEAVAHFHEAARLFFDAGAEEDRGTCGLLAGLAGAANDDGERALPDFLEGWREGVVGLRAQLSVPAGFTYARLLAERGQFSRGREVFDQAMGLHAGVTGEDASLDAQRLEGAARAVLGEIGGAEELLRAVYRRQLERQDAPGATLAALDLSTVFKMLGKAEHGACLIGGLKELDDEVGGDFAVASLEAFWQEVREGWSPGRAAGRAAAELRRQCRMFEIPLGDPFPFA